MIKIEDLLKTKGWEEVKKAIKQRQIAIANKIVYGDCMDVKDERLTQSDLLRAELRCLAWVTEKLPTQLVENPDYNPEEDIEELEDQEKAEIIDNMFKQEFQLITYTIMKIVKATVVKANKGYTKTTSESYKDFKSRKP